MNALDVTKSREAAQKLMEELNRVAQYLAGDLDTDRKLAKAAGVVTFHTSLSQAARMLDSYDSCLSNALRNTRVEGVF